MDSGRILISAEMKPVQGERFQPTGYPDLGAAEFMSPDGTPSVLLESVQSVANHLENACLTPDKTGFIDQLEGLSMVVVNDKKGNQVTNSVREGHRLASPYVIGHKGKTEIGKAFEELDAKNKILDQQAAHKKIFELDVNSLLHGVWFSRIGEGRIKIRRAMSGYIEANGVNQVISGGVKRDHVTGSTKSDEDGGGKSSDDGSDEDTKKDASAGMGSIPFGRIEYVAKKITAYFHVDLDQISSYGLGDNQTELLKTLAEWKIGKFLESPFRPRTDCDLKIVSTAVESPKDFDLPSVSELESTLGSLIAKTKSGMNVSTVQYGD